MCPIASGKTRLRHCKNGQLAIKNYTASTGVFAVRQGVLGWAAGKTGGCSW